jgi:hypothetical protein
MRDYPGAGGQRYHWWSSTQVHDQARTLADMGALISGDFAADRIAPWRKPERVVAYLDGPVDLSRVGYVLTDPGDYTTLVIVPADLTLCATARAWGAGDITDPVIAAHDVASTATTGDEREAIEKLRDVVVERFAEAQRG